MYMSASAVGLACKLAKGRYNKCSTFTFTQPRMQQLMDLPDKLVVRQYHEAVHAIIIRHGEVVPSV